MPNKDPRIDAYIAKSADFAKPILIHLRRLAHQGCPQVEETMKWSMPAFVYHGTLMMMAAFKQHCTLNFWKSRLIFGSDPAREKAMGQFGRITRLDDLPSDKTLLSYIKKAAELNEGGVKLPARPKSATKELAVPAYFRAALAKRKPALAAFEKFSRSHRNEYVEWITEAKREETRARRIETAVQWLSEGKSRNWKYQRC
jgi:uncharacterized protein YdeI (YjbR/CyaY-like superfamily)